MKLRTQIIAAFLLLATAPLLIIVLYSYFTSREAVRKAVAVEATLLAQDMDSRMVAIRDTLESRVARLSDLPRWAIAPMTEGSMPDAPLPSTPGILWERMNEELGDSASLIESFELVPISRMDSKAENEAELAPAEEPEEPFVIEFDADELANALRAIVPSEATGIVIESIETSISAGLEMAMIAMKMSGASDDEREANAEEIEELQDHLEEEMAKLEVRLEAETEGRSRHLENAATFESQRAVHEERREQLQQAARAGGSRRREDLAPEALELHQRRLRDTRLLLGRELGIPIEQDGTIVGRIKPQISAHELLGRVLGKTRRNQGEIPYAIDREGNLYVAAENDRQLLESLPLSSLSDDESRGSRRVRDWVIETAVDDESGLIFGIARPIGASLAEIGRTAVRNLGYGLTLIAFSLIGIIPFSNRISRNLARLTEGAERIASGDLETRVAIDSHDEVGQLANAFNRMAEDLESHRQQLVEEERKRREQEIEQRLMRVDLDRKNEELEEARLFQLSMLPTELPSDPAFELAVAMKTSTEVGGDYYDFRHRDDGELIIAIGDATGHGSKAGTLVTAIKGLFSAYSGNAPLASFLGRANRAIRTMNLERMTMALTVARFHNRRLRLSSAGMPPIYVHHAESNEIEEIHFSAMPLGGLTDEYDEIEVELETGDTVLMMTDGFPELLDARGSGDPLGYVRTERHFADAASLPPGELIKKLVADAVAWGGPTPNDDYTFIALAVH